MVPTPKNKSTIIVGIAGASGSGKSLLAKTIANELGHQDVVVIPEDAYYRDLGHLPFEQRAEQNFDHPNAFEHSLLCEHLEQLMKGESIDMPIYDHNTHSRLQESKKTESHRVIVLEGILLLVDSWLRDLLDIKIYIDTPLDVCLMRRIERDMVERSRSLSSVLLQYEKSVRPMFLQFVKPSKQHADLLVPHGGRNRIAIEMIKTTLKEMI